MAYILTEILAIDAENVDRIIKFLDPFGKKKVNYNEILKLLSDVDYIDKML